MFYCKYDEREVCIALMNYELEFIRGRGIAGIAVQLIAIAAYLLLRKR